MHTAGELLVAIGGLTAIGGFIDFILRKSEQKRLKDWMINWWIRFADVRWANFGQKEAQQTVEIIDHLAGDRLFSLKRLRFAALTSLGCLAFVACWLTVVEILHFERSPIPGTSLPEHMFVYWKADSAQWARATILILIYPAAFAVSISLMKLLAQVVRWAEPTGVLGFVFFAGLVIIQCWLLLYWTQFVQIFMQLPLLFVGIEFHGGPLDLGEIDLSVDVSSGAQKRLYAILHAFFIDRGGWTTGPKDLYDAFTHALDLIANVLRIGFAAIFLSSYVFGPIIQPVVCRVWERIVDSEKPIFYLLFAAIGAFSAGVRVLTA
jgi:hypothetical protein